MGRRDDGVEETRFHDLGWSEVLLHGQQGMRLAHEFCLELRYLVKGTKSFPYYAVMPLFMTVISFRLTNNLLRSLTLFIHACASILPVTIVSFVSGFARPWLSWNVSVSHSMVRIKNVDLRVG